MNIALIIAGGSGKRMKWDIPKQFINVYDKPIIVYTLEAFQRHPDINKIAVVCIEGWHEILRAYAKQYNISKLDIVVNGGVNGQDSIRNGLFAIEEKYSSDDIVLIHDAIRPMVTDEIISDNLLKCRLYGSAITAIPCAEAVLKTENRINSDESIDRDILMRTQTPQSFYLGDICQLHREALERGITNSVASCTLMVEMGKQVHFSIGSEKNIKLTTLDDIDIFKALYRIKKSENLE